MDLKVKISSAYKNISLEDTFKLLESNKDGLSDIEVKNRILKYGLNEIVQKKKKFLS